VAPARDFTRRHFLVGLAASSIAMPAIVPSSVLGRDDKAAPSERITVGFIGCGKVANDYHLHAVDAGRLLWQSLGRDAGVQACPQPDDLVFTCQTGEATQRQRGVDDRQA
jgi:hypothetical protein